MTAQSSKDRRPVIVVGYDGSPAARAAVDLARERAGSTGAVHVVHAFVVPNDVPGAAYATFAYEDCRSAAEEIVASLADTGVGTHLAHGRPATELCRVADEVDADAIVIGTRGVGAVRALLGSVAHDLLHHARRPVTVVPARMLEEPDAPAPGAGRTIVAGYDGSPAARAAVEQAIERVRGGGHLVVVHTHRIPSEYAGSPYYEQTLAESADRARRTIDELERDCEALAGVDYEPDLLAGDPADALCRVADQRKADEILIGTRGVGRVRALLGSVAHDVLHRANRPVTVIPSRMVEQDAGTSEARPGSLAL